MCIVLEQIQDVPTNRAHRRMHASTRQKPLNVRGRLPAIEKCRRALRKLTNKLRPPENLKKSESSVSKNTRKINNYKVYNTRNICL